MARDKQLELRFAQQEQELHVHQAELQQQNEELRQINLEVELAHSRYADLFEHAPVGYVVCDEAGLIVQINKAGCDQLGASSPHLIGRRFSLFFDARQRGMLAELLRQVFLSQVSLGNVSPTPGAPHGGHRAEVQLVRQDGHCWDAQLECTALAVPGGQLARVVLTDISELKRLQRETEHRRAQSELQNTELQTFMHALTHDLTRPLRQVEGFADLLGKSVQPLDEASARHLKHLLLAAANMGALTVSLTQFFQSSQAEGPARPLDLKCLMEDIFHELKPQLKGRQVTLTHDPLPTLHGDRQGLHMIFSHLLANAVKFTAPCPEARIHVGVHSTAEHHDFSVHDNGVGFDPHGAERLFGVFVRLHSERQFQGQGLGLALVRRVAQRLHGQVWAESVPGQGSTFWVRLPRTEAEPGDMVRDGAEQHGPAEGGQTDS